jgi:hypothetical protein
LHDFNTGLKAYRTEVVRTVHVYGELHRFIPVLAAWEGFRVAEIPVNHRPRKYGRSKFGARRFLHGFFDLVTVMFLTRRGRSPLYFFGALALVFLAAGLAIDGYFLVRWLQGNGMRVRPLMLLGIGFIIVGIQVGSMGLLAEMLSALRASASGPRALAVNPADSAAIDRRTCRSTRRVCDDPRWPVAILGLSAVSWVPSTALLAHARAPSGARISKRLSGPFPDAHLTRAPRRWWPTIGTSNAA